MLGVAGGGGVGPAFAKGTAEERPFPVCLGPCQRVLQGLRRGEQTRGFQMVFAGLLLCFPLEGEAATILNLSLEELGKRY